MRKHIAADIPMPALSHPIAQTLVALAWTFGLALGVLVGGGRTLASAWPAALGLAVVSATLLVGSRYRNIRRGRPGTTGDRLDGK